MSSLFEVVPASDVEEGDAVLEPTTGVLATVLRVEPGPRGCRLHFGQVWCLYLDVEANRPLRRRARS